MKARQQTLPRLLFFGAAVASIGGPLAVWLAYSERVVSAGGLAAFVEAAAGRTAARAQALVWTVSYFLYLPYTITYVVYDVLPGVFPGLGAYRSSLELALPAAIFALVLAPRALAFGTRAPRAGVRVVPPAPRGPVAFAQGGAPPSSSPAGGGAADTARGT